MTRAILSKRCELWYVFLSNNIQKFTKEQLRFFSLLSHIFIEATFMHFLEIKCSFDIIAHGVLMHTSMPVKALSYNINKNELYVTVICAALWKQDHFSWGTRLDSSVSLFQHSNISLERFSHLYIFEVGRGVFNTFQHCGGCFNAEMVPNKLGMDTAWTSCWDCTWTSINLTTLKHFLHYGPASSLHKLI